MGLFMGFIREEATLQRMLLKNYPVVLSGLNFYAKYTVVERCQTILLVNIGKLCSLIKQSE